MLSAIYISNKMKNTHSNLIYSLFPESGIIADISLSPDEALENPLWPQMKNHTLLRKSHSVASTSQEHNKIPENDTSKPKELPCSANSSSSSNSSSASSNASGSTSNHTSSSNSDMITVHL